MENKKQFWLFYWQNFIPIIILALGICKHGIMKSIVSRKKEFDEKCVALNPYHLTLQLQEQERVTGRLTEAVVTQISVAS